MNLNYIKSKCKTSYQNLSECDIDKIENEIKKFYLNNYIEILFIPDKF